MVEEHVQQREAAKKTTEELQHMKPQYLILVCTHLNHTLDLRFDVTFYLVFYLKNVMDI